MKNPKKIFTVYYKNINYIYMGIILINIGLPKTMSTDLQNYIHMHTDIISIFPWREPEQTEINDYDFNKLDKNKIYWIKNPTFILSESFILKIIKKLNNIGFQVKLIFGVRDILNQIISLTNHWNKRREYGNLLIHPEENIRYIEVYNKIMIKFYSNIDSKISFLKNYDFVIYNLENCNMSLRNFLIELFKLLDIQVNINITLPDIDIKISDYHISHQEDIKYLKEYIYNFNQIQENFNKVFKDKIFIKNFKL